MAEGFEPPSDTDFDIEAQAFEALCQQLAAWGHGIFGLCMLG